VAAALNLSSLMRILPSRASSIAVAGSVALSFLPQLAHSWQDIREAQAARGHRWRGASDIVPVVVPLLAGGLDRAMTTAEALESRGFGSLGHDGQSRRRDSGLVAMLLTTLVVGLYLFATGQAMWALSALLLAALMLGMLVVFSRHIPHRRPTAYRESHWTRSDTVVTIVSVLAIAVTTIFLQVQPEMLRYDPYPYLVMPLTNPLLVGSLGLLMTPAVIATMRSIPEPMSESENRV
jgi:energy-coupling factor transport system permease protein